MTDRELFRFSNLLEKMHAEEDIRRVVKFIVRSAEIDP